jgi:FlaA1/EpsC-like NDP-sugar epimerase
MKLPQPDFRALAAAVHDGAALVLAWLAASFLLQAGAMSPDDLRGLVTACIVAVPIQVAVSFLFGTYQGIWRYTSLPDIQRVVFSVLTGTVFVSLALHGLDLDERFTYRELVLYPLFLITFMSLSRMAFRSYKEWQQYGRGGEQGTPVIVMGAGTRPWAS